MSDEAIPEDVMKAAGEIAAHVFNAMVDDDGRFTDSDPSELIASAILAERAAERERCAKVATDTGTRLGEPAIGHAIASSIRSSHE